MGQQHGSRVKRVLLVDDDPEVLRSAVRMLTPDVDVKVALSADDALQVLASGEVDTVIADFSMQGPNGAWLLRQVRARYPEVGRVLLSGSSYIELAPHLDPGLVDAFLAKPIEPADLLACLG